MQNNYKYPYYFPQPQLLKDQYKYASQSLQLHIPLPGTSVKLPFTQKPTRFLTINRKHHQIDYFRNMIQQKVDMQQLHYQAKIQQMRRQNDFNRQKLEKLLSEQPRGVFEVPDKYVEEGRLINQNIDKLSLERLYREKQRYMADSVDKYRKNNNHGRRNSQSMSLRNGDQQIDSEEERRRQEQQKKARQNELDYIYKKNGVENTGNHFGTAPILKKEEQKVKQKLIQKKQEYDWVKRVRNARKNKFIQRDDISVDSSKPSLDSSQQKKKKIQQKQKQEQKSKEKRQKELTERQNRERQKFRSSQRQQFNTKRTKGFQRNSLNLSNNLRRDRINQNQDLNNSQDFTLNNKKNQQRPPLTYRQKTPQKLNNNPRRDKPNQNGALNNSQDFYSKNKRNQQKQPLSNREKTPEKQTNRTVSREQNISSISQFSRYAQKNNLFQKQRLKKKQNGIRAYQNIFQRPQQEQSEIGPIPITLKNKNRGNWKI